MVHVHDDNPEAAYDGGAERQREYGEGDYRYAEQ